MNPTLRSNLATFLSTYLSDLAAETRTPAPPLRRLDEAPDEALETLFHRLALWHDAGLPKAEIARRALTDGAVR